MGACGSKQVPPAPCLSPPGPCAGLIECACPSGCLRYVAGTNNTCAFCAHPLSRHGNQPERREKRDSADPSSTAEITAPLAFGLAPSSSGFLDSFSSSLTAMDTYLTDAAKAISGGSARLRVALANVLRLYGAVLSDVDDLCVEAGSAIRGMQLQLKLLVWNKANEAKTEEEKTTRYKAFTEAIQHSATLEEKHFAPVIERFGLLELEIQKLRLVAIQEKSEAKKRVLEFARMGAGAIVLLGFCIAVLVATCGAATPVLAAAAPAAVLAVDSLAVTGKIVMAAKNNHDLRIQCDKLLQRAKAMSIESDRTLDTLKTLRNELRTVTDIVTQRQLVDQLGATIEMPSLTNAEDSLSKLADSFVQFQSTIQLNKGHYLEELLACKYDIDEP